jgi:hypothetical protein
METERLSAQVHGNIAINGLQQCTTRIPLPDIVDPLLLLAVN